MDLTDETVDVDHQPLLAWAGTRPPRACERLGEQPSASGSPDRLDALVWGLSELMLGAGPASAPILLRRESTMAPLRVRAGVT